jgi:diaminohydroxyphosphoribosylaminopyrimidine deaminase/5-amino-6-(5-phosphoribosylamino)uracil reductase
MFAAFDTSMMQRALQLAERGLFITDPNPRVGCVLVKDGSVVGEGFTSPVGGPHAEVIALRSAGAAAAGATAYVTLEPCSHFGRTPPCVDALLSAKIARVVFAIGDPNPQVNGNGAGRLQAAGVQVESGLLADEARELNVGFFTRMREGRPWVVVKLGMSLDGKVALANGVSQWITSETSRLDVQKQRARSSAILTGVGTVLADDPRLTIRASEIDMQGRKPLRVICDSKLRTPTTAQLFREAGSIIVLTASADEDRTQALIGAGAEVLEVPAAENHGVDLNSAFQLLATRGCNEVFVEAGPRLTGCLIEQGLVDELLIYMAPVVLGSQARSPFELPAIASMAERWSFRVHECRTLGPDLRLRFRRVVG